MKAFAGIALAGPILASVLAACGGGSASAPDALTPIAGPGAPPPVFQSPTPPPVAGPGLPLLGPAMAPNGAWGAPAVATALAFPVQLGYNGSGFTIALVTDAFIDQTDLQQYLAFFRIPQTTRTIVGASVDGGPISTVDAMQSALDLETIAALAPGANIIVYETPTLNSQNITDAYKQILHDRAANVVVSPFGTCEGFTNATMIAQPVIATGTSEGITFIAASGDSGASCTEYPASDPNTIGVGGTETYPTHYTLTSVTTFNDFLGPNGTQESSGGGASQIFFIPPFQQGLTGTASPQFRNVPDIAMPAAGAAVRYGGNWLIENGTFWGASQFAALMVETYQFCNIRFELGAELPYEVFDLAGYAAFNDVYLGNNSFDSFAGFEAQRGYDSTSGIGVPLGVPFTRALCPTARTQSRSKM